MAVVEEGALSPLRLTGSSRNTENAYTLLFTHHRDTESTEGTIFLPDRETRPPRLARMAGRRRSGKRSQPCGHDLVIGWFHANGWIQAQEFPPQAEALFPGRRLPARGKTPCSVYSVPLW
jgi:hypothetical protein